MFEAIWTGDDGKGRGGNALEFFENHGESFLKAMKIALFELKLGLREEIGTTGFGLGGWWYWQGCKAVLWWRRLVQE